MKTNLTQDQLKARREKNKRILKYFILPVIILWIIILMMPSKSKQNSYNEKIEIKTNIDSIIGLVKADKLFEIKDVYYNEKDSSFNIAFTNKGNVITDKNYSTLYFNDTYHIDKFPCFDGIILYAYKKGKSLKNGDYGNYLYCESKRAGRLMDIFKEKYCSGERECYALTKFLKEQLNDPGSYESQKIIVDWAGGNRVRVTNTFRAKNGFGGLMLQKCQCDFDIEGNGYDFKFIE